MCINFEFTEPQRRLFGTAGSVFVEACPGAGKTQAVIQRFISRPGAVDRRGIALLSFTNAASNEARDRCAEQPDLLYTPNFVGTIDAFVHRFIVGRVYRWQTGRWPSFRDSWAGLQGTDFTVRAVRGITFQLEWFNFDTDGDAQLDDTLVPPARRHAVSVLTSVQKKLVEIEAQKIYRNFLQNGITDAAVARSLMWKFLNDAIIGGKIGLLLEARFREVIIDEAQDCNFNDMRLIEFLLDVGVEMVLVGDLEQSIFGFRGASFQITDRLTNRFGAQFRLDQNFRSAPSICSLINSLRYGDESDLPAGPMMSEETPIQILKVDSWRFVKEALIEILRYFNISPASIVVLAHAGRHARTCAGGANPGNSSSSRLVRFARSAIAIQDSSTSRRDRDKAMQEIAGVLRSLAAQELQYLSDEDFLMAVSISQRSWRDGCFRLAYRGHPYRTRPSEYNKVIKASILALGWGQWADLSRLRTPSGDAWEYEPVDDGDTLRWSTIHSFKGLQSEAVALVIPEHNTMYESGVDYWARDHPHESRRVLYVGASRAQRLLVLVTHKSQISAVLQCLERDGVPFELRCG